MKRYFIIEEISQDRFIEATGEDLDCCQMYTVCDGFGYVAVDDTKEDEFTVCLDIFEDGKE